MGRLNTLTIHSHLCNNDSPRRFKDVINKDIYRELDVMSGHNPAIMQIAQRLAEFISELLREDGAPLLDIILAHAMTEWSTRYATEGCHVAYREFCTTIFKELPKVFEYRVTGRRGAKPFPNVTWDATECGLVTWMEDTKVTHLKIEHVENNSATSQRELSFLVAHNVFSRNEIAMWGIADLFTQKVTKEQEIVVVAISKQVSEHD